jgi:hypothetical protein
MNGRYWLRANISCCEEEGLHWYKKKKKRGYTGISEKRGYTGISCCQYQLNVDNVCSSSGGSSAAATTAYLNQGLAPALLPHPASKHIHSEH